LFIKARAEQDIVARQQPGYGPALCMLGLIDAALGRKEQAISEGRRAAAIVPINQEAVNAAYTMKYLAVIYAWCGERELAIQQLNEIFQHPTELSYGFLKLYPFWDPLRGDPRFEKIVSSLAPK